MPVFGSDARRQVRVSTALAALLACAVLLPLLGHKPLSEWDEGIYAEVSREMLGGSWLVPHWNYQVWLEKPPLTLWITAIFFKLFGVSEFWARAGSALSGVGIVALLHGWLARGKDMLAAWLSTVILLATLGFLHICHVGEMDTLLSFGVCMALIGLSEVDAERSGGWYLFWVGFAVALMSKGAASIVIPLAAVVFGLWQRWGYRYLGRAFWLGLALFLLLTLPWHLAMLHWFGRGFVAEYLGLHVLARATQQIEGHRSHWYYYVRVLLVSAPPFVLLYPVAVYRARGNARLRVWAIFAIVVVAFFTAVQTRLPHYVAPAYPALAVVTAVWVADWLRSRAAVPSGANALPDFRVLWRDWKSRPFKAALGAGFVAVVWAGSVWATHSGLKSLHSAASDGAASSGAELLDNKEADALLRRSRAKRDAAGGPLLLWRDGWIESMATVVFYAQRRVQQVELEPLAPGIHTDRYMVNPKLLNDVVGIEPGLILLDKSLLPQLPPEFRFHLLAQSPHLALGTIVRTP